MSRQPTMMNLFPCEASPMDSSVAQDVKPKNMFPRQSSFSSSSSSGTKEEVDMIKETKYVICKYRKRTISCRKLDLEQFD